MLNPRDFQREDEERDALINILMEWYPYPWQTWSRKATNQLWAVYYKGKPVPKKPTREELEGYEEMENTRVPMPGDDDYRPLRKTENGVDYILADSGEYVEIED